MLEVVPRKECAALYEENDGVVSDATEEYDGYSYTPDELAMFGGNEEVEAEPESEETEVFEDSENVASPVDQDELAWVKEIGADKVKKTWDTFTQKTQELAEKERSLQPALELMSELQNDPALAAYIAQYFQQERTPMDELYNVRSELQNLKTEMTVKEELAQLHQMVAEDDTLVPFEDREVVTYARDHNLPDLQTAYRLMTYDDVRRNAEEKAFEKVKKTRGAAIPKVGTAEKQKATSLTQAMIDKMSDEELAERYDEVAKFYGG